MKILFLGFMVVLFPCSIAKSVTETQNTIATKNSQANVNTSINGRMGMMNFTKSGYKSETGSTMAHQFEWAYYAKRDAALFFNYRAAGQPGTTRQMYLAGSVGVRHYPYTLAVPVRTYQQNSIIDYDFGFKPYLEASFIMGKYLIDTFAKGAADISSEFWGIGLGGGMQFNVFSYLAFDTYLGYESDTGYGSPVDFQATNIYMMIGVLYYR